MKKKGKSITGPIDAAKKAVMDLFRKPLELLSGAETKIKGLMTDYTNEQERKAKEDQERLEKLAEKEAEKEKKKIDAKIERAEASGNLDKVEELQAQKETITPLEVPVVSAPPKAEGVSYRETWKAIVKDFKLLPDEYKLPNQSALDKVAQATKGKIPIPGVEFKMEKTTIIR